jgi:uncharacterized protein (DUF2062 family)
MGDSIMLVCAVLASLAAGVLAAYGVCLAIFAIFRPRTRPLAIESKIPTASPTTAVEG